MKKEIAVGILFFIALSVLGYYTIIMTGQIWKAEEEYTVTAIFPNVEGLSVSDRVKINGVLAGKVDAINLIDDTGMVLVSLKMTRRFKLYENYEIKIKSESALGGRYVSIYPGKAADGNRTYAEVYDRQNLPGRSLDDPLSLLAEFIQENRANVYQTISNIKSITQKIDEGKGTLGRLINDNRVHENTDGLIKELRDAIEDTREQAPITSFIRAALTAF